MRKRMTFDFNEGKWDHFPETVGKGTHICAGCRYSEPLVEFVGIGTVRRVKNAHECMLEPNQRRSVSHVISCEAFEPRARVPVQMTLEAFL